MAELIGGSGYDDVQATAPSNPSIGDTWLDTSDGEATGKIYADLGNGDDWQILPVQDELQSGRTRELLLLLQDKPISEVVDPLNIQTGMSQKYATDVDGDYKLGILSPTLDDFEDGNITVEADGWSGWSGDTGAFSVQSSTVISGSYSGELYSSPSTTNSVEIAGTSRSPVRIDLSIQLDNSLDNSRDGVQISLETEDRSRIVEVEFVDFDDNIYVYADNSEKVGNWNPGSKYTISYRNIDYSNNTFEVYIDDSKVHDGTFGVSASEIDYIKLRNEAGSNNDPRNVYIDDINTERPAISGNVTDRFAAPTTAPTDFKQWNTIQAQGVTTGGSTSADPVEFEILDSTDTVINSSRIPKARIADEPFTMRNRVYSESAGSNGQSDYQIATTGEGGHFGIPILTVVSVKKNGSVLNSANWSFDGDTTVTIDTSNVTIASGDTVDIKYDFDVFDSTLQLRAYLNREATSETSPSISHFRYEYLI